MDTSHTFPPHMHLEPEDAGELTEDEQKQIFQMRIEFLERELSVYSQTHHT